MTHNESEQQKKRLAEYDRLSQAAQGFRDALNKIEADDPDGPCGQGPFTGNTRESRDVLSLEVFFSRTKGGSAPVKKYLDGLKLGAWKLRALLAEDLREKIKTLEAAIEAI